MADDEAIQSVKRGGTRMPAEPDAMESGLFSDAQSSAAQANATAALAKALQSLALQANSSATLGLDETIPGGAYMENGVLVDAWGRKIGDAEDAPRVMKGARTTGTPSQAASNIQGRQPGPAQRDSPQPK